jgi:hypothetical protein
MRRPKARRHSASAAQGANHGSLADRQAGNTSVMSLGSSLTLIAIGAILRYALTTSVSGVSLPTIGLILMIVGIVGLALSIFYLLAWRPRRGRVLSERTLEREPPEGF